MTPGHADLLALDDLPYLRASLARKVGGFVLVDHPVILSEFGEDGASKVIGLIDHHSDRHTYPNANPRIVEMTGSCSSLVAQELLNAGTQIPTELASLLLSVIALDTDSFRVGNGIDRKVAKRLLPESQWADEDLDVVIKRLDKEMSTAKKDLANFPVRSCT